MHHKVHNQIVSFIWGIADDVLRDVFVRGKYRDIILPFTVLRRIDVLLEETKEKVLETDQFFIDNKIPDKSGLEKVSGYPFYNTSRFTMGLNGPKESKYPFVSLLSDPDNIDSNLESYLDGFSPNIQEIISKFKIRNQLETMKDAGITYSLIEKLTSNSINLSPNEVINSKGEKLPPLTNLGMGYVFEELIRKFNEENNEEAGEHFTPREIISLMTHILFEPVKDTLRKREKARFSIYDPACGSGGMLTEAEKYALKITNNSCSFSLFGQEVNPETWAICTGDMLIKGERNVKIAYGSTLSNDAFVGQYFDFMLSNPPYGKAWKIDEDTIVEDRGKSGKETIKDPRFRVGLPSISDGQMLFLVNMISKMKSNTELGSRIASVHNGSALFTGDAGQGESEIRRMILEKDLLECIIALPTNIFYNTGIPTYIWILSNNKEEKRKGKVQLINAVNIYERLRKNLGQKNCILTNEQIEYITKLYLDFEEDQISKIFNNDDFGYWKITVERPLRLKARITKEAIETLRYHKSLMAVMKWVYQKYGDKVYVSLKDYKDYKQDILKWAEKHEIKLSAPSMKNLFSTEFWNNQKQLKEVAEILLKEIGDIEYNDFNVFKEVVEKTLKNKDIKLGASDKKAFFDTVSWKDEEAERVVKSIEKDGTILYEADSELRDSENVPLDEDINIYFDREVKKYVPDAWIDENKTVKGYSISFTRYFYSYEPPRSLDEISEEIQKLQNEIKGTLEEFLNE